MNHESPKVSLMQNVLASLAALVAIFLIAIPLAGWLFSWLVFSDAGKPLVLLALILAWYAVRARNK